MSHALDTNNLEEASPALSRGPGDFKKDLAQILENLARQLPVCDRVVTVEGKGQVLENDLSVARVEVEGKAAKPVYLWVHDGEVELKDASHLWGKVTADAEAAIQEELGDT